MSKLKKIQENNKQMNSSLIPLTPKTSKENLFPSTDIRQKNKYLLEQNLNSKSIVENKESPINTNSEIKKSPKEILSYLLRQSLNKSLIKLESRSKEQMNNLKLIYKNFILFDKSIKLLKAGVEKKRKEDAKKLIQTKKLRENQINNKYNNKTPLRIRSKTYQKIRTSSRENSRGHYNTKTNINRKNSKLLSNRLKRRNEEDNTIKDYSKIRAKSTRTSRFLNNNNEIKSKTSKENINKYIAKTPKRSKDNEKYNYRTEKRLSGTSSKNNEIKDENTIKLKNEYNTINNNSSINSSSRQRKKSIKNNERTLKRRKSSKGIKSGERSIKRKFTNKKNLKIDGDIKLKNSLTINSKEKIETPLLKEIEKKISNFNFSDINIINNNINILTNDNLPKDISNLKENNDTKLNSNENININEIIKEKSEKKNYKEEHKSKNTIKELGKFNLKKPKFDEEEKEKRIRKRMRSYNKNRSKKDFDSISIEKDFEGSLNDVKLMIEGVSGVLNKINVKKDKNSKFKNKVISENSIKNQNCINEGKKKENEGIIKEDEKIENNKKKFLNDLDKQIMELIEEEEKRKNIEKEKENEKNNLDNNIDKNNIQNIETEKNKNENNIEVIKENNELNIQNIEDKISEVKEKDNQNINSAISKGNDKKRKSINNLPLIKDLKIENEKNIMNEELINKINTEENILNKSLNEIKEDKSDKADNDKNIISENNKNIEIGKEKEINENNSKKNIYLDNIEKQLIEKTKLIYDEQNDIIQNESRIMRDEQLVDLNNQSLNQSSLVNQSSVVNQSLIEQYIILSKEPNLPFSIENTLKYEKITCLGILDFLNFQEKMEFTGITRAFNIERISLLNYKRENYIRSLELSNRESIDDLIMKVRLKYSKEELSKPFKEFEISRGPAKAVELLNNDLYSKLFKKDFIEKNEEEICNIYRIVFILFDETEIANISNDKIFWKKCTEYLSQNSNGKIGTFILEKFKNIIINHKKIFLLNKLLIGMKKRIIPTYFSKICGTTGLLIFLIKDVLEFCGVIINEKKTQPARILDNLIYYKNVIDTLALFIDYLSGIKTYRIKLKKSNK